MIRAITVILMLQLAVQGARAEDLPETFKGPYVGAGLSSANVSVSYGTYYGWCCGYWDYEAGEEDTGYGIHAGYRVNRYFAVEAVYLEAGSLGWQESFVYVPDLNGIYNNDVQLDYSAGELLASGVLPFAKRWELYLKGGIAFWEAQSRQRLFDVVTGETIARTVDGDDQDFVFAIGLGVSFARAWHLRMEFSSIMLDETLLNADDGDATVDVLTLEMQYRFRTR